MICDEALLLPEARGFPKGSLLDPFGRRISKSTGTIRRQTEVATFSCYFRRHDEVTGAFSIVKGRGRDNATRRPMKSDRLVSICSPDLYNAAYSSKLFRLFFSFIYFRTSKKKKKKGKRKAVGVGTTTTPKEKKECKSAKISESLENKGFQGN